MPYVCKHADCTGDIPYHLIHGDPECWVDNKEAIAEWAAQVETRTMVANVNVYADGFEGQTVSVVLHPPGYVAPPLEVVPPVEPMAPPMEM